MNNIFYNLLIILKNVHQISPHSYFVAPQKYKILSDINPYGVRCVCYIIYGGDLRYDRKSGLRLFTPRLALIRPSGAY